LWASSYVGERRLQRMILWSWCFISKKIQLWGAALLQAVNINNIFSLLSLTTQQLSKYHSRRLCKMNLLVV
jgi:hypothetical protein